MEPDARDDIVLVTGLPRSGTTPLGAALAKAWSCPQVYEPMNAQSGDLRIRDYFAIPGVDLATEDYEGLLTDISLLRLKLRSGVFDTDRGLRRIGKLLVGGRTKNSVRSARLSSARPLVWKDPFALFTIRSFTHLTGRPPVVIFRDPAALAASFHRLQWSFDTRGLAGRLRAAGFLARGNVSPDPSSGSMFIDSAVELYNLGYGFVLKCMEEGRDIVLINNADLASNRMGVTTYVSATLGVELRRCDEDSDLRFPWPRRTRARDYGRRAHSRTRNVHRVNTYYEDLLGAEEVAYVRTHCEDTYRRLLAASAIER